MTLPYERTRSVNNAREFLVRLTSPYVDGGFKRIPTAVRQAALRLLRHYPSAVDLRYAADSFSAAEADRILAESAKSGTGSSRD